MANPLKSGPVVSPVAVASVICLVIGGVAGYGSRLWIEPARAPAGGGAPMGMGGMGGMGGGGGMGGMGGGGGQANPRTDLTNMVRGLFTIEKVAGADLKSEQVAQVLEVAQKLQSAKSLSDDDCKQELEALDKSLTEEQKAAVEAIRPRGGGGGGGGGMGGMMGGMGGMMGGMMGKSVPAGDTGGMSKSMPAGGPPMGGMGGMGKMGGGMGKMMMGGGGGGAAGGTDNPFAEGPSKERLDELVELLKKKAG